MLEVMLYYVEIGLGVLIYVKLLLFMVKVVVVWIVRVFLLLWMKFFVQLVWCFSLIILFLVEIRLDLIESGCRKVSFNFRVIEFWLVLSWVEMVYFMVVLSSVVVVVLCRRLMVFLRFLCGFSFIMMWFGLIVVMVKLISFVKGGGGNWLLWMVSMVFMLDSFMVVFVIGVGDCQFIMCLCCCVGENRLCLLVLGMMYFNE